MNNRNIRILTALLFTAALAVTGAEAAVQQTTKGGRIAVAANPPAGPAAVAVSTHQGPIVDKKVVRQYVVDSKKQTLHEQAAVEQSMPMCRFVTKRDGASKETHTVMVHLAD